MKKNTKKKFRDIRNAIVMMCVMAAMLSTASYAWFTLTDSPTVTGMNMTAASTGGLVVGLESNGTFHDAVKVKDSAKLKVLKPVTPGSELRTFETGVYSGNKVVDTAKINNLTDYVATYTYYLHSTATSSEKELNIGIICGDATKTVDTDMNVTASNTATLGGSIVRAKKGVDKGTAAPYAIRIGLIPEGSSTMYIWEPNNDGIITNPTMAENKVGEPAKPHVSSVMAGTITPNKSSVVPGDIPNVSGTLFTMKEGGTIKVDMYVWLEGKDAQCANEIQAGELEAQIQFTVVDEPTTNVSP